MVSLSAVIGAAIALLTVAARAEPSRPFPAHATYQPGTTLPLHRSREQLDADVVAAWQRWKQNHLIAAGTEPDQRPRFRVRYLRELEAGGFEDVTVSEAQGYGMLLAAYLAGADPQARTIFDGLYEFSADHPSEVDARLFDWDVPASEVADPDVDDSAFDGDADIAYALLLADVQWGSASGAINYRAEALSVLAGIAAREIGPTSHLPLLGDWVIAHPEFGHNEFETRPSDFLVGHFRVFGEVTGDPIWTELRNAVLAAATSLREGFAPITGFLPDFAQPVSAQNHALRPADPNFLEGLEDGFYYYNAVRVPWRLGIDALLSGESQAWDAALAIAFWVSDAALGDPTAIAPGYKLDGTPLTPASNEVPSLFAAPIGVASMLDPELQDWLEAIYDGVRERQDGYYPDSVALLCMVAMTGNWWEPIAAPEPAAAAIAVAAFSALAALAAARSRRN